MKSNNNMRTVQNSSYTSQGASNYNQKNISPTTGVKKKSSRCEVKNIESRNYRQFQIRDNEVLSSESECSEFNDVGTNLKSRIGKYFYFSSAERFLFTCTQ